MLARSNGEVVDLLAGGQGVFNIVPLSGVVDELDADIAEIGRRGEASGRDGGRRTLRHRGAHEAPSRRGVNLLALGARRASHPSDRAGRAPSASPTPPSASSPPCSTSTVSAGSTSRSSSPCAWNEDGDASSGFRPDFWLPDHRCFVELTTADQRLVTRKNAKVRRLRELYPEVRLVVVYQRQFRALLAHHGLELPAAHAA